MKNTKKTQQGNLLPQLLPNTDYGGVPGFQVLHGAARGEHHEDVGGPTETKTATREGNDEV